MICELSQNRGLFHLVTLIRGLYYQGEKDARLILGYLGDWIATNTCFSE